MSVTPTDDFAVHQETDAIATRAFVMASAVVLFVGSVGVGVAWLLLVATVGTQTPVAPVAAPRSIANVEQTPILDARDGLDLRERQEAELLEWGWADRDAGIARIPIDRAIDLVVERESR